MPNYAVQSPANPMRGLETGGLIGYSFGAIGAVAISALTRNLNGTVSLTTGTNHNFAAGEIVTLTDQLTVAAAGKIVSVAGTRFGGNYLITAIGSPTTATLQPLDDVIQHQPIDTATGGQASSIQYEAPGAPQAGKAFALGRDQMGSGGVGFYVNGVANGAPGAAEIDIQVADVDNDVRYQTGANMNITTFDATNNTFHLDGTWTSAKFVRAKLKTNPNAVGWIVTIGA